MVTLQILVLPFLVRVQVGQQREIRRALDVELGALFMLLYVRGGGGKEEGEAWARSVKMRGRGRNGGMGDA